MRNTISKTILMLFLCVTLTSFAQESSQVGTSMANFLKIGVGSKANAMGDANVAMTDDASALYWNAAGIALLDKSEVLMQATPWIAETNLYFIGIAFPLGDIGSVGASFYNFSSGEMEETTLSQPDGTGRMFSAGNYALGISYAKSLTDRFSVGFTVKYINEYLSRENADAFAFDIGSIFRTSFLNDMKLGISISNLGSAMELSGPDLIVGYDVAPNVPTNRTVDAKLGTQSWDLPLIFRFGAGTYVYNSESTSLSVEADVNDSRDYEARYAVGSEFAMMFLDGQKFLIRAGYKGNYDEESITAGMGLYLKISDFDFKVDYAYADFNRLGSIHRYSISILF